MKKSWVFLVSLTLGTALFISSAYAEVNVYYSSSERGQNVVTSAGKDKDSSYYGSEDNVKDVKKQEQKTLEAYQRKLDEIKAQSEARKNAIRPPLQPTIEQPTETVVRRVRQHNNKVNGIQGSWLPKKVWEPDVEKPLIREKATRAIGSSTIGPSYNR